MAALALVAGAIGAVLLLTGGDGDAEFGVDDPSVGSLVEALTENSAPKLYENLAFSVREGISADDFAAGIEEGQRLTGPIEVVSVEDDAESDGSDEGSHARVGMALTYADAGTQSYEAIFVREDGEWRLLLTREIGADE